MVVFVRPPTLAKLGVTHFILPADTIDDQADQDQADQSDQSDDDILPQNITDTLEADQDRGGAPTTGGKISRIPRSVIFCRKISNGMIFLKGAQEFEKRILLFSVWLKYQNIKISRSEKFDTGGQAKENVINKI